MSAYVIGHYNIHDIDTYMKYTKDVGKIVSKYDGKTIVADYEINILEGSPDKFIVIVKFESMEKAKIWYESKEYQDIIKLRKDSTTGWVIMANEFKIPVSKS